MSICHVPMQNTFARWNMKGFAPMGSKDATVQNWVKHPGNHTKHPPWAKATQMSKCKVEESGAHLSCSNAEYLCKIEHEGVCSNGVKRCNSPKTGQALRPPHQTPTLGQGHTGEQNQRCKERPPSLMFLCIIPLQDGT